MDMKLHLQKSQEETLQVNEGNLPLVPYGTEHRKKWM